MFETRKKEHEAKVRLTKKDLQEGKIEKKRKGIESEKLKFRGKTPLNNYDHPEDLKLVILEYVRLEPPMKD